MYRVLNKLRHVSAIIGSRGGAWWEEKCWVDTSVKRGKTHFNCDTLKLQTVCVCVCLGPLVAVCQHLRPAEHPFVFKGKSKQTKENTNTSQNQDIILKVGRLVWKTRCLNKCWRLNACSCLAPKHQLPVALWTLFSLLSSCLCPDVVCFTRGWWGGKKMSKFWRSLLKINRNLPKLVSGTVCPCMSMLSWQQDSWQYQEHQSEWDNHK